MKKKTAPPPPPKKETKPHSGVDRRKKTMTGRKYAGTVMTKY